MAETWMATAQSRPAADHSWLDMAHLRPAMPDSRQRLGGSCLAIADSSPAIHHSWLAMADPKPMTESWPPMAVRYPMSYSWGAVGGQV